MARDGKEAERTGQIHVESRTLGKEGTNTYRVTYTEEGRNRYISSHVHGGRKGQIHIESRTRRKEGTDTYISSHVHGGRKEQIHIESRTRRKRRGDKRHVDTNKPAGLINLL